MADPELSDEGNASDFANRRYGGLRKKDIDERRKRRPDTKKEQLASVIRFVYNGVERVCLEGGTMFKDMDDELASNMFYLPLSGAVAILEGMEREVFAYSHKPKCLKEFASFNMKAYLSSEFKTDGEKVKRLKRFVETYGPLDRGYTSLFSQVIDGVDPTIEELKSLISLLSSICREGDELPLEGGWSVPSPTPSPKPKPQIIDLESEGDLMEVDEEVDRTDESGAEAQSEDEAASNASEDPTGGPSNQYYYDEDRNEIRSSPEPLDSQTTTPKASVANSVANSTAYSGSPTASPAPSHAASTVRVSSPMQPDLFSATQPDLFEYGRTPTPPYYNFPSQSPLHDPAAPPIHYKEPDWGPYKPRSPSPIPDFSIPPWKRLMGKKYPVERLAVSETDIIVFAGTMGLAQEALKQAKKIQVLCSDMGALAFEQADVIEQWEIQCLDAEDAVQKRDEQDKIAKQRREAEARAAAEEASMTEEMKRLMTKVEEGARSDAEKEKEEKERVGRDEREKKEAKGMSRLLEGLMEEVEEMAEEMEVREVRNKKEPLKLKFVNSRGGFQ